jgi:catechol 2,3-dioxygenase-like lactoylglutathione lyase family enzyme
MIAVHPLLLAVALTLLFTPTTEGQLPQPTPSPSLSIAHAAIRVSDLAKSREFYRSLGFEEAFVFEKDGAPIEVFLKVNDRQFIELYPRENVSHAPSFMHVCFESPDLEGLRKLYAERGVSATAVSRGGAGNLLFSVRYPEQQVIEFTEYMSGSMHSNDRGKHLGAKRISTHIAGVGIPAEDATAAVAFYEGKLGFPRGRSSGTHDETLKLPGASGEMIKIQPQDMGFTLYLAVADLQQTTSALSEARISVKKHGTALLIVDPDGNRIVFVKN